MSNGIWNCCPYSHRESRDVDGLCTSPANFYSSYQRTLLGCSSTTIYYHNNNYYGDKELCGVISSNVLLLLTGHPPQRGLPCKTVEPSADLHTTVKSYTI